MIGKLFAYKAILQSSVLIEPKVELESWTKLLDLVYGLARDVPWLREECGLILVQAVESLSDDSKSEPCLRTLGERLVSFKMANTPEGIAIWLALRSKNAAVLPGNVWQNDDPLSMKNRAQLSKILKGDIQSPSDNKDADLVKTGAANPNPPFAWNVIISKMLAMDSNTEEAHSDARKSQFGQLWLSAVDAHLFGLSSSHERKAWGFKLFAQLINQAPDWALPALFSPNFMRTLSNQSRKDDRFLHAAALNAWKAISHRAKQSPSSSLNLAIELTSKNGTPDFDQPIKMKTLEQILLSADDSSLRKIVRHLHSLVIRPDSSEQSVADHRRQTIADLLLNAVKHYTRYDTLSPEFLEKDNWLRNVLDLFVEHAYFIPSQSAKTRKVPLPSISEPNREMFQERLLSCLTRLLSVDIGSQKPFGVVVVDMIRSKSTNKAFDPVFKADQSVKQTLAEAFDTLDEIVAQSTKKNRPAAAQGFVLLYAFTIIQIFNGDADSIMMLHDLDVAQKSVLVSAKAPATEAQDGFIEILLSFLGNPRTLFHKIAAEAFTACASGIGSDGIQSMIAILETEESLEGQKQLFQQEDETAGAADEEDEDEDDEDEDMEDASDVEMVDGGSDDSDDSSSDDSESEDESEGDEEDAELTQFNNMLAMTLQTKIAANGDSAEDSSDESDMDDEQMMALDPHLSNIFKQRSQITGKKQRKDAKKNVVQFKARVLDLLAIYLDKQYSNPLTLDILVPILRLTRATANKQLTERSAKLLKTAFETHTKRKTPLPVPENINSAWEVLEGIHQEAKLGGGANVHMTSCSAASLHLARVLTRMDVQNYPKILGIYAGTWGEWYMDGKSAVQPVLFQQFLNWSIQGRGGAKRK